MYLYFSPATFMLQFVTCLIAIHMFKFVIDNIMTCLKKIILKISYENNIVLYLPRNLIFIIHEDVSFTQHHHLP